MSQIYLCDNVSRCVSMWVSQRPSAPMNWWGCLMSSGMLSGQPWSVSAVPRGSRATTAFWVKQLLWEPGVRQSNVISYPAKVVMCNCCLTAEYVVLGEDAAVGEIVLPQIGRIMQRHLCCSSPLFWGGCCKLSNLTKQKRVWRSLLPNKLNPLVCDTGPQ